MIQRVREFRESFGKHRAFVRVLVAPIRPQTVIFESAANHSACAIGNSSQRFQLVHPPYARIRCNCAPKASPTVHVKFPTDTRPSFSPDSRFCLSNISRSGISHFLVNPRSQLSSSFVRTRTHTMTEIVSRTRGTTSPSAHTRHRTLESRGTEQPFPRLTGFWWPHILFFEFLEWPSPTRRDPTRFKWKYERVRRVRCSSYFPCQTRHFSLFQRNPCCANSVRRKSESGKKLCRIF